MKHALLALLGLSLVTLGCDRNSEAPPPQTTAQTAKQEPPKPDVKLVLSLQPSEEPNPEAEAAGKAFANLVAQKTGFAVEAKFPRDFAQAIRALKKDKTQVTLLSGWAYLRAHHAADGDLLVADERDGKTSFEGAWFVTADSKVEKLADLEGKRIAFSSPTSAPGFLLPYAKLIEDGVVKPGENLQKVFKEIYFTGEADALKALLDGKVDAAGGAIFAPELYLAEADRAKVKPLATIDGAPTHVLAVRADFDRETREKLEAALLALNETNAADIKAALGMEKLVKKSHGDHMMKLQNAQELVGTEYVLPEEPEPEPAEVPKGLENNDGN